jgi:hypothetical protein
VDRRFGRLVLPAELLVEGLIDPADLAGEPELAGQENWFGSSVSLSIASVLPGTRVRYTRDGSEPGSSSPQWEEPLTIEETTLLKLRAFDADDQGIAHVFQRRFELRPVRARIEGLLPDARPENAWEPHVRFDDELRVTLESRIRGGELRYTLDGSRPTGESASYVEPLTIGASARLRVRVFVEGRPRGELWERDLEKARRRGE